MRRKAEQVLVAPLARAYRPFLASTRFIGVTGSCGKTSTKELTAAVLARSGRTHRSFDSNNIYFSAARTILETRPWHRNCVIELSASGPGSLDPVLELVAPRISVVTTVGLDHYKAFRGEDAVADEKRKIVAAVPPQGVAVLNQDDPRVIGMADSCRGRVLSYGLDEHADVRGFVLEDRWPATLALRVTDGREEVSLHTRLFGRHMATSVLAALATGIACGVKLEEAARAIEVVPAVFGRMSSSPTVNGVTFIHDHFKAPLWSMEPVLDFLANAKAERTILLVGTLSDYGGDARRKYEKLAEEALRRVDLVLFCSRYAGSHLRRVRQQFPDRLHLFAETREASAFLEEQLAPGDLVLLKGSVRADHLERVYLDYTDEVHCWLGNCGREIFCQQCERRYVAAEPRVPRDAAIDRAADGSAD